MTNFVEEYDQANHSNEYEIKQKNQFKDISKF